jgi:hypothetical protein
MHKCGIELVVQTCFFVIFARTAWAPAQIHAGCGELLVTACCWYGSPGVQSECTKPGTPWSLNLEPSRHTFQSYACLLACARFQLSADVRAV